MQSSRREWFWRAFVFVAAAVLYLCTICPTVYFGDSGDLATAVATGGVPHPPGYPLYGLLGRLALRLFWQSEPAGRLGAFSAVSAAGAIATLYSIARRLGASRGASAGAAGLFAAGFPCWSQSVRVEVYGLHLLLLAQALDAALAFRESGNTRRDLSRAALAFGLGLTHHLTIVMWLPALVMLCGASLWRPGRWWRRWSLAAVLAITPLALYMLLILWARAEPSWSWGRIVDLPSLKNHVGGNIYASMLALPNAERWGRFGVALEWDYWDAFPGPLLLLPPAAIWLGRQKSAVWALLLGVIVPLIHALCYRIVDITPYFLGVWLVLAALSAIALDAPVKRSTLVWLNALALSLPTVIGLARNRASCDLHRAVFVRELARQKLLHCPPGAVLLNEGDQDMFPVLYTQDVLKIRPDVTVVQRSTYDSAFNLSDIEPSLWYVHRLRKLGVDAPLTPPSDTMRRRWGDDAPLIALLEGTLANRPLATTFTQIQRPNQPIVAWIATNRRAVSRGVIVVLAQPNDPTPATAWAAQSALLWKEVQLPDLRGIRTDTEVDSEYFEGYYASMLGRDAAWQQWVGNMSGRDNDLARVHQFSPRFFPSVERWVKQQPKPTAK